MRNAQEAIKIQFKISDEDIKQKIYQAWRVRIPMQKLFEELIKQADLEYYQNRLADKFLV